MTSSSPASPRIVEAQLTDEMIAAGAAVLRSHISDAPIVYTHEEIAAGIFVAMIRALKPVAE